MSNIVWISRALEHASNQRPFRNDVAERDETRVVQMQRQNERGEPLDAGDFPSEIFGAPHADEKDYDLPHLFYGYGFWVVSKAAAHVLRQFDLGQARLAPVRVLKSDRRTPVDGEWFCIGFGNQKNALLPEESKSLFGGAQGKYTGAATVSDGDVAVSVAAFQGPDLWVDAQMWDAIFLSEHLGNALRKSKADKGFMLKKCRVIDQ